MVRGRVALSAAAALLLPSAFLQEAAAQGGDASCPCLDWADLIKYVDRDASTGAQCLVYTSTNSGKSYCYPADYGNRRCAAWDRGLAPYCGDAASRRAEGTDLVELYAPWSMGRASNTWGWRRVRPSSPRPRWLQLLEESGCVCKVLLEKLGGQRGERCGPSPCRRAPA